MSSALQQVSRFFGEWRILVGTALAGMCLAILFSLAFIPLQYGSTERLLITLPDATGLDPYTAMKSTERIAGNLTELIYTSNFFHNALAQAKGFDPSVFSGDEYSQRSEWQKTIEVSVAPGTGILTLTAYHRLPDQANALADAVGRELALEAPNFFGYSVRVQVIDAPLNTRWYARPNILMNGGLGLVAGFCVA